MNFLRISSALKEQYFFWSTREASGFHKYINSSSTSKSMVVVKLNRTRLSHSIPLLSFYTPEIVNALINSWCICSKLTTKSPEWHHLTSFLVTSLHKKMKFTQFSENLVTFTEEIFSGKLYFLCRGLS